MRASPIDQLLLALKKFQKVSQKLMSYWQAYFGYTSAEGVICGADHEPDIGFRIRVLWHVKVDMNKRGWSGRKHKFRPNFVHGLFGVLITNMSFVFEFHFVKIKVCSFHFQKARKGIS